MKILVLSYEYPPIGGGGGIICKNISENLVKSGNEVTVLTTAFSKPNKWYSVFGNRYSVSRLNASIRYQDQSEIVHPKSEITVNPKSTIRNPKSATH